MKPVISHVDPRTRMAVVMVVSTLAVAIRDPVWLAGILLATCMALLALGGAGLTRARFARLAPLFAGLLVIQSVFASSGEPLLTAGPVTLVTTGGVVTGVSVILRMLIVIFSASLLVAADPMKIVRGLVHLRVPYELAFMVLLGVRFLPLLIEDFRDALTAIQLRGVNLREVPAGRRLALYRSVFLPVVVTSVMRAQKTATAMEARAFRACPQRTWAESLSLSWVDRALICGVVLAGAASMYIHFSGGF